MGIYFSCNTYVTNSDSNYQSTDYHLSIRIKRRKRLKKKRGKERKKQKATGVVLKIGSLDIIMEFKFTFLVPEPYHFDSRSYLPFEEVYSMIPLKGIQKLKRIVHKVSARLPETKP